MIAEFSPKFMRSEYYNYYIVKFQSYSISEMKNWRSSGMGKKILISTDHSFSSMCAKNLDCYQELYKWNKLLRGCPRGREMGSVCAASCRTMVLMAVTQSWFSVPQHKLETGVSPGDLCGGRESAAYSGEHVAGGRGSTVKWGQLDRGRHCGDGIGTGAGNDDILPGKIFQYSTKNKKETSWSTDDNAKFHTLQLGTQLNNYITIKIIQLYSVSYS